MTSNASHTTELGSFRLPREAYRGKWTGDLNDLLESDLPMAKINCADCHDATHASSALRQAIKRRGANIRVQQAGDVVYLYKREG
mgnify:CR=1 FL=1